MTDVDDLPWAERDAAERKGRMIAESHHLFSTDGRRNGTADAIAELLAQTGVVLDATDEAAIRGIVGEALRGNAVAITTAERKRILAGMSSIGARLSAAEYAVIGKPSPDWWFSG